MSKKVGRAIAGLACIGAAAGAVIAYLNIVKNDRKSLDEDFDDFSDEFEKTERSYTTIPKDVTDKADSLKEKAQNLKDDIADTAADITKDLKSAAMDVTEDVKDAATDLKDAVKDKAEDITDAIKETITE
ncbi:hypothetical protein [Novisyntrophococcus fermenticellae]|uniref:hypothetical protein n=1 Tax=Novisyntrophococcus fermenticellae TaxID=2068655 RepID=UPI001E379C38|nr:hypothetical protein [Novisyntrophococcus fermenticellae]